MSHVVTCKVKLTDRECLNKALEDLGLEILGEGTHTLYNRQKRTGLAFKLPDWNYPVVIDQDGTAHYDNYGGSWGKQVELDRVVQKYSVNVAEAEAAVQGYTVETVDQENGDVELIMTQLAST